MGNPQRIMRKRVRAVRHPIRRAPDGSAFQRCDECGIFVAVALLDMHDCDEKKKDVKKFKGNTKKMNLEEPRSPFVFFVESYAKTCKARDLVESNRQAFQKWKNMSLKDRLPYFKQAHEVESAYLKAIDQEIKQLSQEDDEEADSATVGKFSQWHQFDDYDNIDSDHCSHSCDWPLMCPWHS